jgi:hypothetical protein
MKSSAGQSNAAPGHGKGRPSGIIWNHFNRKSFNEKAQRWICTCMYCEKEFDGRVADMQMHITDGCLKISVETRSKYLGAVADKITPSSGSIFFTKKELNLVSNTANTSGDVRDFADKALTKERLERVNQSLLRAFVYGGVSFRFVSNPFLQEHYRLLNSTYKLPDVRTLSNTLLCREFAYITSRQKEALVKGRDVYCTSSNDGWSTNRMASDISTNVTLNTQEVFLIDSFNASKDKHSSKYIAG